ncbi:hypothetical protein F1C58_16680 (plasmid) [Glaciihabitans sp. INWT7]|uniref:hypothetical protein n=1 Tax=Glaciihabitans sp. INWT7 TaxID=2596912 RepID=UPI0016248B31|nr:hypothetical protein [Glaciihabitans sp. INWT7]QNE48693.1 hypothetical protein F1C58_16680 [Glaciihabitans sp. INWT7]
MTDDADFEPAEVSAAKNIAYATIGRSLERVGVDAESEDSPINLSVVADDVVEALLAQGVTIPEEIIDPFSGVPAQCLPLGPTGFTDAETLVILRAGARALRATTDPFNVAVAEWLHGEALVFAGCAPFAEITSLQFEAAGGPIGYIRIGRLESGDMQMASSTVPAALRVALAAIEEVDLTAR